MTCRHVTFPSRVSDHTETDATSVLTGLSGSQSVWVLTNCAADALVLTGGGLGGCCWVCAKAGAAGEVRLTYSDRSISNWGTQGPTNQTRAEQSQRSSTQFTGRWDVYRWKWRTDRQDDWFLKHTWSLVPAQQCLYVTGYFSIGKTCFSGFDVIYHQISG